MHDGPATPEQTVMNRISVTINNMPKDQALAWLTDLRVSLDGMITALLRDLADERVKARAGETKL